MDLTLGYIIALDAPAITRGRLSSLKMSLPSPFLVLCSLLALLGSVEAQNSISLSSSIKPPASSIGPSSSSLPSKFYSLSMEPSSTSLSPPLVTSGFSRLGNVLKPAITSYTFHPFPTPSESSIPGVFPETWPNNPPPVDDPAVPNFGPAWDNAYNKARETVSAFLAPQLLLPLNPRS